MFESIILWHIQIVVYTFVYMTLSIKINYIILRTIRKQNSNITYHTKSEVDKFIVTIYGKLYYYGAFSYGFSRKRFFRYWRILLIFICLAFKHKCMNEKGCVLKKQHIALTLHNRWVSFRLKKNLWSYAKI